VSENGWPIKIGEFTTSISIFDGVKLEANGCLHLQVHISKASCQRSISKTGLTVSKIG